MASHFPMSPSRIAFVVTMLVSVAGIDSSRAAEPAVRHDEAADTEVAIEEIDRDHWAFDPVVSPPIPEVADASWPRTSIDRFLLAKMQQKGVSPAEQADRVTLIRRLAFDVTGLPPSVEDVQAFLGDTSQDAYDRLVDRLLASPQYGRRWGQYWLDLARFAETDGYEHDKIRPEAWKYRDWVIQALCDDMPYDRFVALQVAGDEILPDDPDAATATAFCLSGPDMPDINSQEERKHVLLNEIASTVGSVFLSLQMGCAQCHDHKYDPISQADFYRLRAFFDRSVKLKANVSVATLRTGADEKYVSRMFRRGDWRYADAKVTPAPPRVVSGDGETQVDAGTSRSELARWLTSPSNPLVARSIVNRIWQFHFGRGLSETPSDFGLIGDSPSHPELLDYLASELVRHGWSLKWLHREILCSAAYRTRSMPPSDPGAREAWENAKAVDPENRLLTRFRIRRLDAEAIRDAMYASSGTLDHRAGGAGVSPPLPVELVQTLKRGQWKMTPDKSQHYRRSIYIFSRRNLRYPMFATFDRPAANCSCADRHESTTAVQSLLLLNSEITRDAAERLANVVVSRNVAKTEQVRDAYRRVFSREPSAEEVSAAVSFLEQPELKGSNDPAAVLTELCRALFNANAFLYVD